MRIKNDCEKCHLTLRIYGARKATDFGPLGIQKVLKMKRHGLFTKY